MSPQLAAAAVEAGVCQQTQVHRRVNPLEWTRSKNNNQQIPVKISNPGRNPSYYTVSSTGFASFDQVFLSGELLANF